MEGRGFATPTGDPCPRSVREDGTVEGSGHCSSCGCCLLLLQAAWPDDDEATFDAPAATAVEQP